MTGFGQPGYSPGAAPQPDAQAPAKTAPHGELAQLLADARAALAGAGGPGAAAEAVIRAVELLAGL